MHNFSTGGFVRFTQEEDTYHEGENHSLDVLFTLCTYSKCLCSSNLFIPDRDPYYRWRSSGACRYCCGCSRTFSYCWRGSGPHRLLPNPLWRGAATRENYDGFRRVWHELETIRS